MRYKNDTRRIGYLRNEVIYGIREEVYCFRDEKRSAFGIVAYPASKDGDATVIASVGDVCSERDKITKLVGLCNALKLDPSHLYDVVEDFLSEHKNKL